MTTIRRQFRRPVRVPVPPCETTSRIARQLALAHHIEALIDAGKLADYAQAAQQLGLTRARLTQITNLLLLAPGIQEQILLGQQRPTERALRSVIKQPEWNAQSLTREPGTAQQASKAQLTKSPSTPPAWAAPSSSTRCRSW